GQLRPRAAADLSARLPNDAESEPRARRFRHCGVVRPVELLKQLLATISRNPDSIIGDANDHFSVALSVGALDGCRNRHPKFGFGLVRILNAVRDVIHTAELDYGSIDFYRRQIVIDPDIDTFSPRRAFQLAY